MHLRVAVRVHHVAFLHPGLDSGGINRTIAGGGGKWKYAKKSTGPSPLLSFGGKKGSWKNPQTSMPIPFGFGTKSDSGGKDVPSNAPLDAGGIDAAEVSEIITAEALRLSRDGIIQQHYALQHAAKQPLKSPRGLQTTPRLLSPTRKRQSDADLGKPNNPQNSDMPTFLSPAASSNRAEAARYYKECAERPKGYRRLVVSSAVQTDDVKVPMGPVSAKKVLNVASNSVKSGIKKTAALSTSSHRRSGRTSSSSVRWDSERSKRQLSKKSSWDLSDEDATTADEKSNQAEEKNEFNNVEFQYIGPPNTGPDFFQLLRYHGAATFGRYLPEISCSVPKHSIGFELRKSRRRRAASTQPIVIEAPHVIWGDARDNALCRIAAEGCPLIDARPFEYTSNVSLMETELSESLMVCGSTVWVENAKSDDASVSSSSTLKSKHTKNLVKAKYYGGKVADGVKDGITETVKGVTKGTKVVVKTMEKGTKEAVGVGKKIIGDPIAKSVPNAGEIDGKKKKKGLRSMFKLKKKGRRKENEDGLSVDGSLLDDASVGSESIATHSETLTETVTHADSVQKQTDANEQGDGSRENEESAFNETTVDPTVIQDAQEDVKSQQQTNDSRFAVVKPVPYVLILDDIINLQVVSFPDKEVVATFPISVASVMVQRSMDDRMNDPLKPSELTATLIQEPSAQQLRWGVELKVTVRAVEVKPNIPKVLPIPDVRLAESVDVVQSELIKVKDKLMLLGKPQEEIQRELNEKEAEISKRANDLDSAIVAAGFGKGEDEGASASEIRRRQMFYDSREHVSIRRKQKRRHQLSDDETQMINDARLDPSIGNRQKRVKESISSMMSQLNAAFPGIERGDIVPFESKSHAAQTLPLHSIDEGTEHDVIENDASKDTFAEVILAMATSLDKCLGEFVNTPTLPVVKQHLSRRSKSFHGVERPTLTSSEAKLWCSEVAKKLNDCVDAPTSDVREAVSQLQSVIVGSAEGNLKSASQHFPVSPRSSTDSAMLDPYKLVDWCTAVASKLEECAEDIDVDSDDDSSTVGNTKENPSSATEQRTIIASLGSGMSFQSVSSRQNSDGSESDESDDSSMKQALQREPSGRYSISDSTHRIRTSTSVCTIKKAMPYGKSIPTTKVAPLLKGMRYSHFQMHRSLRDVDKSRNVVRSSDMRLISQPKGMKVDEETEGGVMQKALQLLPHLLLLVAVFSLGIVFSTVVNR